MLPLWQGSLTVKNAKKCALAFFAVFHVPVSPSASWWLYNRKRFSHKLSCQGFTKRITYDEHVTYIVKKGSKRLHAINALKKSGLIDTQLILVYCSVIRSVLEYASPAWAWPRAILK